MEIPERDSGPRDQEAVGIFKGDNVNKKDIENIGYILSSVKTRDELLGSIFELDERIKDEYELFEEAAGRSEAVNELTEKLMVERYGHKWALLREHPPYGEVLDEARRVIYGDDYHPSIFK